MPSPELTLYDWRPSPFCMKVRALLAYKAIPFRTLPALQHVRVIGRRGGIGKVPAVELDGAFLVDSTDIAHALERRFPERPLIPADPRQRALCHALEDWADEALYFRGLYFHWAEPRGQAQARRFVGRSWLGKLMFWPLLWRILRQLRGQGTGRKTQPHIEADLGRDLDAIEGMLVDQPFLLGPTLTLCDLSVASQLVYLSLAPVTRELVSARPALQAYLERVYALTGDELRFGAARRRD